MANPLDPFGSWREALQKWEQDTNAAIIAATGNEGASKAMSQSLALMAKVQARQAEAVEQALERANLPSRADFRRLDARLDELSAQMATLTELVRRTAPPGGMTARAQGPARTRKPPGAPSDARGAGAIESQAPSAAPAPSDAPSPPAGSRRRTRRTGKGDAS